jgi:hypothetical protein
MGLIDWLVLINPQGCSEPSMEADPGARNCGLSPTTKAGSIVKAAPGLLSAHAIPLAREFLRSS